MTRVLDLHGDLPTLPLDPETVLSGTPAAGSRALTEVGGAEIGVWEITAGTVTDVEVDEVFVVLSGSASVTFEDGETIDLGPGVAVRLRAGDRTTWVVRETLRKIYVA
ncbi:DUF861 domain-containing protein [Nocardioides sp. GY 10113]|uniref:cupin domain-containing protein n=1 Tax=Nocardioides sp. GY 10113 TaxID=2569761 RepID=UPI0010A7E72B|nr:cupin domain-containing protein [Nocardioides sp. GY 10113]TIC87584.1 DUF861 domain-containing protein [Nocardioides sp. GY 10113]